MDYNRIFTKGDNMDKKSWREEHTLKETGYPRFSEYRNPRDRKHQRLYEREEKKDKKNLSKALEGRDYIKIFENTTDEGKECLYLPLTWLGSKYLASDYFLPKIQVPSNQMDARDFSDTTAKNEDLSPGAKWRISLWTVPDLVINNKPVTDLDGKEFRHEGKRYWLDYTSGGAYFLFYFRDYKRLKDIFKKEAFTLKQGSPTILGVTLADNTSVKINYVIEEAQEYWNEHYQEYESQIKHIQEVSKEEKPKFEEYEEQKRKEAREYYNSHRKEIILREDFTYNESTGRYDSNSSIGRYTLQYLVKNGKFEVPLGVINGKFDCSGLGLESLRNGPTEVKGDFDCSKNVLTTLEGAPKRVGGYFDCDYNKLTILKYAPQEVGGWFGCCENRLTDLIGAPQKVGGGFDCSYNYLTTLAGGPKKVGKFFYCNNNELTSLAYAPEYVERDYNCSDNNLETLKYAPKKITGRFDCSNNHLTSLEYAPQEIGGSFDCRYNPLQSRKLPKNVRGNIYC